MNRDAFVVESSFRRSAERVVAADKYYVVSNGQFDNLLAVKEEYSKFSPPTEKNYCCWFARAIRFLRIKKVYSPKQQRFANRKILPEGKITSHSSGHSSIVTRGILPIVPRQRRNHHHSTLNAFHAALIEILHTQLSRWS